MVIASLLCVLILYLDSTLLAICAKALVYLSYSSIVLLYTLVLAAARVLASPLVFIGFRS